MLCRAWLEFWGLSLTLWHGLLSRTTERIGKIVQRECSVLSETWPGLLLCLKCTIDKGALNRGNVRNAQKGVTACLENHIRGIIRQLASRNYILLQHLENINEREIAPSFDECERLLRVAAISWKARWLRIHRGWHTEARARGRKLFVLLLWLFGKGMRGRIAHGYVGMLLMPYWALLWPMAINNFTNSESSVNYNSCSVSNCSF